MALVLHSRISSHAFLILTIFNSWNHAVQTMEAVWPDCLGFRSLQCTRSQRVQVPCLWIVCFAHVWNLILFWTFSSCCWIILMLRLDYKLQVCHACASNSFDVFWICNSEAEDTWFSRYWEEKISENSYQGSLKNAIFHLVLAAHQYTNGPLYVFGPSGTSFSFHWTQTCYSPPPAINHLFFLVTFPAEGMRSSLFFNFV